MPKLALAVLEAFEAGPWGQNCPAIAQAWRRHWDQVIPFFVFSPPIRRIIYTTNTIDALNSKLRRRCAREAISRMTRQQ
jgi:putative transposase